MDVRGVTINMDLLKDDDFVYEHFNKLYEWDIDKLTEQEKKKRLESTIKSMERIGAGNQYLFIRNSFLREIIPADFSKIKDLKEAYIARERMRVVDFFDSNIAGFFLGGAKQFYHIGEEAGTVKTSYRQWAEFEPFYDLEGIQKECISRDGWTNAMSWAAVAFADVEDDPLKHPAYKASCITVQIQRIPGDDANYCIDEYPYVQTLRYGAIGVQVALSVAVTAITAGAAAPVTAVLLATTSVGAGALEEIIARRAKWPAYNREGIPPNAKVPIAEKIT